MLQELNDTNGASELTKFYSRKCLEEFNGFLIGAEFGVAYGGGIARIGADWKDRGVVYGFDTFEGHPKEIANICEYSKQDNGFFSSAATAMDFWYEKNGIENTSKNHITKKLDSVGINNVFLVKGLITEKSNIHYIPYLNYCLLDLDFPLSMIHAWNLVKNKIVKGGYLCLHDVVPRGHIHGLWECYQEMISENLYDVISETDEYTGLAILRKK